MSRSEPRTTLLATAGKELELLGAAATLRTLAPEAQQALTRLGAIYLACRTTSPDGDPVARFHLDNGARLERLNPLADLSSKGLKQSFGLMVNYLYDLRKVESHHEKFTHGEVAHSRAVSALL